MLWLQENWWIAAIVAVLAILIVVFLVRRSKAASFDFPEEVEESTPKKAAPPLKPLEPKKPEIIAAEPARFKPLDPVVPPAPAPAPTPAPVAEPDAAPAATPKAAPEAPPEAIGVPPAEPAPAPAAPATATATAPAGDNLRLMKGVGPKLVSLLTSLGITSFAEIAAWTEADIDRIDAQLGSFAGRIRKDNWVEQASYLAKKDKAGFEAKFGALSGEL